ncbi:MAG: 2-hydroxychromene-2-carboxylate isomerase [Sulfitobacter sp.]|jgi:2-hydroxychromene-2-carboxylate isomerase
MPDTPEIEYFYAAHSAYAYLGAWELSRIARETGAQVIHRPFDFLPVVDAAGGQRFKDRKPAHIAYFFGRELTRWAQWRNLPMIRQRPRFHDSPLHLANGMIIAAGQDADAISKAILQAHWRDDADIADAAVLARLADALGLDSATLLQEALSDAVQAQHVTNTQEAIARNVFGSPCYFVQGDMFYGQDRLDMVARAVKMPFAP